MPNFTKTGPWNFGQSPACPLLSTKGPEFGPDAPARLLFAAATRILRPSTPLNCPVSQRL
jgi:hypothetical protein